MAREHDDELIKIKKCDIKDKPKKEKIKKEKPKREKREKKSAPKVNSVPRAKGVHLDFTNEAPEVNRYWLAVSKRYRVARYVSMVALVAFLLVMLLFYRDNITYANLVYLARDLDSDTQVSVGVYSDITYDRSFSYDFGMFRQRIAVAGPKGFALYSQTGGKDLSADDIWADPRLEVGEKYALVYDAGEKSYSVFTTIARVLSAESEFEIEDACVSDSGYYALLTRSKESRYLVSVYNDSFRMVTEYYKDKLVMDMAIDAEGENIAMASATVDGASVTGELMIGKIGSEDTVSFELSGMMPLAVEYTDDGSIMLLCDTALLVFDGEKEKARVPFEGLTPGAFALEGDILAVSFPTNATLSQNALKVFDTEGNVEYNVEINNKVTKVSTDGKEAVYAVGEGWATCLSLESGKTVVEAADAQAVDALSPPGSLIVCTPEGTTSCFTESKDKK